MSVRLVVFDLGGVLVWLDKAKLLTRLARDSGRPAELIEHALLESGLTESFELGQLSPREFHQGLAQRARVSLDFDGFVQAWNGMLSENREATWLLERLRRRYTLGVLSNTNVLHDEHIRGTWSVFAQVRHWLVSYRVGVRKPDPRIYEALLKEANMSPGEAVYIDDIPGHVEAAGHLGLTAIHFQDALKLEQDLRLAGLDL